MTIHSLSDTELNEVIAKAKGWQLYNEIRGEYTIQVIYSPESVSPWENYKNSEEARKRYTLLDWSQYDRNNCINNKTFPDFTHDSGLAMALLEEMKVSNPSLFYQSKTFYNNAPEKWGFAYDLVEGGRSDVIWSDTKERAICEAFAEWKGL